MHVIQLQPYFLNQTKNNDKYNTHCSETVYNLKKASL